MNYSRLKAEQQSLVDSIVDRYRAEIEKAEKLTTGLRSLVEIKRLSPLIHSIKARTKDPAHLRDKLARKILKLEADGGEFTVTPDNLFEQINDLSGIRLLHMHTKQFGEIDRILKEQIEEEGYAILEGPEARVWDLEYRQYFESIGIRTVENNRMYTSVHYVVQPNRRTKLTAEIQVRTLAEELWGEVDHSMNYPDRHQDIACQEQIKVLARVTSSCTRLVDSIFVTRNAADERSSREKAG